MSKEYEKKEILEKICIASRLETLGFFIGSGFSKAIMNYSNSDSPSWLELLKRICKKFKINESLFDKGFSCPLIASKLINLVAKQENIPIEESTKKVKISIAEAVNLNPSKSSIEKYQGYFEEINPQWIITTNYDNIIEKVVGVNAYPILPNYLFYKIKDMLPIYHIHGSVLDPQSIVITNSDYTKALRPSDYRHSRLPILLKENTVLTIGYGIGDLNVLSAIDYRNNLYGNLSTIENEIIQLVYTENPSDKCYENDGIIIYEFSDLTDFFNGLIDYMKKYKSQIGKLTNAINRKKDEFIDSENDSDSLFIKNSDNYRYETINFINNLDNSYCYIYQHFISFLNRVFNITMNNARQPNMFEYYDIYINILIDLLKDVKIENVPIVYISFLADRLGDISFYLGKQLGQAFKACDTWNTRKNEIPKSFISFVLTSINELNNCYYLRNLLKDLSDE